MNLLPLQRRRLAEELAQQILDETAAGPYVSLDKLASRCDEALSALAGSMVFGPRVATMRRLLACLYAALPGDEGCAWEALREYVSLTLRRGNKAAKALQAMEARLKQPAEIAA